MESCGDCLVLEHRLSEASEHYVDLIVQQNRVMRDNHREASGLEATPKTMEAVNT